MASGKVRRGEDMGAGWIDKTEEAVERAKRRLVQLNELLAEEGKTTVIKPDAPIVSAHGSSPPKFCLVPPMPRPPAFLDRSQ